MSKIEMSDSSKSSVLEPSGDISDSKTALTENVKMKHNLLL